MRSPAPARPAVARAALAVLLLSIYGTLGVIRPFANRLRDAGLMRPTVLAVFVLAGLGLAAWVLRDARLRSARALSALAGVAALYAAVVLPMESPEEKLHFVEYGLVALLAEASLPAAWGRPRRLLAAALFVLAAGWVDEGIQALLPERYYDLRDVGFNALAGVMALFAQGLVRWVAASAGAPPAASPAPRTP
jgi:hypothetical protein